MKALIRIRHSMSPQGNSPPPLWIQPSSSPARRQLRARSNDGQKGMGLIMLISSARAHGLRAQPTMPPAQMEQFITN
jgi:hypothetical protein